MPGKKLAVAPTIAPSRPTGADTQKPRVWIELDRPRDREHAEQCCKLANVMLERIGYGWMEFWYHKTHSTYCLGRKGDGTYRELRDRGEWFDLELIAQYSTPQPVRPMGELMDEEDKRRLAAGGDWQARG